VKLLAIEKKTSISNHRNHDNLDALILTGRINFRYGTREKNALISRYMKNCELAEKKSSRSLFTSAYFSSLEIFKSLRFHRNGFWFFNAGSWPWANLWRSVI